MELSAEISARRLAGKIGRTMKARVERMEGDTAIARSATHPVAVVVTAVTQYAAALSLAI